MMQFNYTQIVVRILSGLSDYRDTMRSVPAHERQFILRRLRLKLTEFIPHGCPAHLLEHYRELDEMAAKDLEILCNRSARTEGATPRAYNNDETSFAE